MSEPETVRMIYVGQRIYDRTKAPAHGWLEMNTTADIDDSALRLYHIRGWAIGSVYEVRVKRDEAGNITGAYPDPEFTRERVQDREQIAAWQAIDYETKEQDKLRKLHNNRKRTDALDLACNDLFRVIESAKSWQEATMIADAVRSKLLNNWARPK